MDLAGLKALLERIEHGRLCIKAVDNDRPSPLAEALIHAPRYSYLDEAAAEERRTRNFEQPAAKGRRGKGSRPSSSKKPAAAIYEPVALCKAESTGFRPDADGLERLLLECGFLSAAEGEAGFGMARPVPGGGWTRYFSQLVRERRALAVSLSGNGPRLWVALERLGWLKLLDPGRRDPAVDRPGADPGCPPIARGDPLPPRRRPPPHRRRCRRSQAAEVVRMAGNRDFRIGLRPCRRSAPCCTPVDAGSPRSPGKRSAPGDLGSGLGTGVRMEVPGALAALVYPGYGG